MDSFTQFISANMYIVVGVLFVLGVFMKKIPAIPDWVIPFGLTAVGIGLGIWIIGAPDGILQGILCAGGAVLVNQMWKQGLNGAGIDKNEKVD